ncbi:LicD family protein [Alkalibacter saccharofermentans]|uniref:Lipopolysaccharide cholinephosphotransferase n=1 Tax=Alkalibacter saccharofermentans DSM 14828 TaxID=1120975 RepID=A0A1M4ZGS0_9FIRM|nr:LicD family protein [Alkalibacter saccharofermentans]SHF17175.1 lipopolysaccharide cholinephosphotransferase [Alkalibacter saccharofermentans DSM 14828]
MTMKKLDIDRLHQILLEALKEVHRICLKYDIKYYMVGGSLIGAVRHKGFVPWDADIDLAMMRSDYDKFLSVCEYELSGKYFLQNYHTDVDFSPPISRLCVQGTYVCEHFFRHLKFNKGAYLDVFSLDNIPNELVLRDKQKKRLEMIDKLMIYKLCIVYDKGILNSKLIAKKIIQLFMIPLSLSFFQRNREKEMTKYNIDEETEYVCQTAIKYGYDRGTHLRSTFGDPVLMEFEGEKYYVPHDWDSYLKTTYGDYMKLPPIEERKPVYDVYEL